LAVEDGLLTLYRRFASNIVAAGVADLVVPMSMTSDVAARILAEHGVTPDVVLLDGSHDADQLARDLRNYDALLSGTGVLFGDD